MEILPTLSLKITLARSSAGPNPIFPTSGSNFSLSVQLTPPYSLFRDASYYKDPTSKYKLLSFIKNVLMQNGMCRLAKLAVQIKTNNLF